MTTSLTAMLDTAEGTVAPSVSAVVLDLDADGAPVVRFARAPERGYDLASLTKVLCTTEVAVRAIADGKLDADMPHPMLPRGVTPRLLLQHASGWPAHRELFHAVAGLPDARDALVRLALSEPLEAPPGMRHTYSDLGFLALGAVLEQVLGARIDALLQQAWPSCPLRWSHPDSEPTDGPRGGAVNDENARAMGGIAPHAGLYGTALDVALAGARWLRGEVPRAAWAFTERGPGSHALGWDTAATDGTSTAGGRPPPDTVGHLGFTGTSLWMSPSRRRVAVLLTNRVAITRDPAPVRALRRAFHQGAWDLDDADASVG